MIAVAALPARLPEELGHSHGTQSGLANPVLVRAAFPGAASSKVLVEQQETPRVEQRREPPERAERRGVEVGVEGGERHPTNSLSELGCE